MPDDAVARWTVSVSKKTDDAVRAFLARRGRSGADLAAFIEEAVRWRVFDQTLIEVRDDFAHVPPDELEALMDDAVAAVRSRRSARTK